MLKSILGRVLPLEHLSRRLPAPIVTLCYHGLRTQSSPASWLRVPAESFRAQLTMIQKMGEIVDVTEFQNPQTEGREFSRLRFLLTFDDGYEDNHRIVLPILRKSSVSATFFVSTEHLESRKPFWFDRVLTPILLGKRKNIDLRSFGLGTYAIGERTPRWERIEAVLEALKSLESRDCEHWEEALAWFDTLLTPDEKKQVPLPLLPEQIREMVGTGCCYVGSHAHKHRILTRLTRAERLADLRKSQAILQDVLGYPPRLIAYPNGDWNHDVLLDCREIGFERGFTTDPRPWVPGSEPLLTPRIMVGGYDTLDDLHLKIVMAIIRALRQPAMALAP